MVCGSPVHPSSPSWLECTLNMDRFDRCSQPCQRGIGGNWKEKKAARQGQGLEQGAWIGIGIGILEMCTDVLTKFTSKRID